MTVEFPATVRDVDGWEDARPLSSVYYNALALRRVMARARSRYLAGEIDVRYFEAIVKWAVAREDEAQ